MDPSRIVLRDVHVPASPDWWPPAPGWWIVAGVLVLVLAMLVGWRGARKRRLRRWTGWFDRTTEGLAPTEQIAAMSELLRRAARGVDAKADRFQGDEWLRFLDGDQAGRFSHGDGRVLLDGAFRTRVDADAVERVRAIARRRFLELMAAQR